MTTISSVATALIGYSLAHVRQGKLIITARPNANRPKMTLTWEETDEWPQEIPLTVKRTQKDKAKNIYLGYRWGRDVDVQIKALAGDSISVGEMVVFLLTYAMEAHKQGQMRLKEETIVVSQKVSATWQLKNELTDFAEKSTNFSKAKRHLNDNVQVSFILRSDTVQMSFRKPFRPVQQN